MRDEPYTTASPQDLRVDKEAIRATIAEVRHQNVHSFLMLRSGQLIWEEYFRPGEADRPHALFSVSKSFLSTAFGMAEAQGLLSLNDKLYDFFPEYAWTADSDDKRQVTLAHMLMMGSGFENNEAEILHAPPARQTLPERALAQPIIHAPGTVFNYYTLGSYLLSAVFSKVYPRGVHHYLRHKLFAPMGFGCSEWESDEDGIPMGGFGLRLTAYDLTRLGQLYLQGGQWQGQQLVPKQYVAQASSPQISNKDNGSVDWVAGYGYQFWMNSFGGFRADGMLGQYILMLPQYETVVVMTSRLEDMQKPLTAVSSILLPGLN
ncbi:MAG: beta-lactamase family protein [Propionibacteriaceae bacterium]|jgi:CubicO group peptidase (beta-lactamase class C family)|nr:beta-lactamase family protein [Propionibacteriaceae bacterium]